MAAARIMITSVGSLLGRGILSTLRGRRDQLFVLGGDLDPGSVGARICDVAVPLPPTTDADFAAEVAGAVTTYGIDLVIPGRDPDAVALAGAGLPIPGPPPDLVAMSRDKVLSAQWCASRDLPFCPTVATGQPDSATRIAALIVDWGLPLILKPRAGSGSLGVRILLDADHVHRSARLSGMLVQPLLDPPAELAPDLRHGIPLFWEVECRAEFGVQALIGPEGEVGPWFCFESEHSLGRNARLAPSDEAGLAELAQMVVPRLAEAGWRGPVNLQARRSPRGWQMIEINPRFSGGTSARYLLGFDEVGWVLNRWFGREVVTAGPEQLAAEVVWLPQEFGVVRR